MSRPFAPSGRRGPVGGARGRWRRAPMMSSGRWIGLAASASSRRQVSIWSGSHSESPIGWPWAAEEREAHAAADDERVDDAEQRLDDAELVADLGAAEHGDERAPRVLAQAEQHLDLLGQQAAGRRRQRARRPDDRRVGAVGGAERVVDVGVHALDQPGDERRVVGLLTRVEAQVLQQLDARRQLGQPLADRRHRVLRVGLALGPAEVAARDDGRAPLLQPRDRGQRGADAEVVGDRARRVRAAR